MQKIIDCDLKDIVTESDVEQKFIIPLLLSSSPLGLEYSTCDFKTKSDIRKIKIDKGKKEKYYFPDYAIIYTGLPLLIVEAKSPDEDLMEGYREARLYASEINSQFPSKINPCYKIIVSNANETIAGYWDSENDLIKIGFSDVSSINPTFFEFSKFVGRKDVFKYGENILSGLRGATRFSRPLSLLGGKTVQNEELRPNGFGSTISLEFKYLFNPESSLERKNIVLNAYVKTNRLLKQVDPIEKVIRATIPLGSKELTKIQDTSSPSEIITKFANTKILKNQLLLLVGSVGSGKSTFGDYLREVALSEETRSETIWVSVNLNLAPLNREEIYKWLKEQIIQKLIDQNVSIDFEDAKELQKIYSAEFNALKKGPASFYQENSENYNKLLSEKLIELENNIDSKIKAFIRFLCAERNKLLVIVLDNCDKRNLEDQLLMFDVSNWLKVTYNCLVFLPLRDTTFDNFKKEPPLDTVIKDFVFRIDPPLLREVITSRIKYAFREMGINKTKLSFTLPNGISVEYPHTDQGFFLVSIVRSLFESPYFSRLITGLAGRNIRKGLEIFLDFCKSGHINESEILKIRQSKGQYILQNHLISRVIIRSNKIYYSDSNTTVRNLFSSDPQEFQPNPFTRISILKWLKNNLKKEGPSRTCGYHKISNLFNELISYGHSIERLRIELLTLLRYQCVITESQSEDTFNDEDLINIAPSGLIHLELLNDINYIASCAEDVWFKDIQIAEDIQKRITDKLGNGHFSKETALSNSKSLIDYLENYKKDFLLIKPQLFIAEDKIVDYLNLDKVKDLIEKYSKETQSEITKYLNLYPKGTEYEGEVVSIKAYGIFVEFGLKAIGFIHCSNFPKNKKDSFDFDLGERVWILVKDYKSEYKKFDLEFRP